MNTVELNRRRKISKALMGNKNGLDCRKSKETREKIRQKRLERKKRLGYINSPETRIKMSLARKGKPAWNKGLSWDKWMSEKGKEKVLKNLNNKKENHYNWKGGISFEPYSSEFNKQLKLKIRQRDNFTCQICEVKEKDYFQKLSVNHIDFNKYNCKENNLITLCRGCNSKINYNRNYWLNFLKEKVQRLYTENPSGIKIKSELVGDYKR